MLAEGAITQSWDTAIKAGKKHDASACVTVEFRDGLHRILEVAVQRAEYPTLKRAIVAQAERFAPHAILIEDKASGQSLLQDLRRETALPLIAILPKGDKVTRVVQVTGILESKRVALPKVAPWLAAFETELMEFPNGAHDDQVDALAQYLNWVRDKQFFVPAIRSL